MSLQSHQTQNIVFLSKRFGLAIDVDGAHGPSMISCAWDSSNKSTFISCNYTMQKRFLLYRANEMSCVFAPE